MAPLIPLWNHKLVGWKFRMTTCIAAITDEGKALILVADKMIGVGWVESELEITKMRELHNDWWMLFAGDDITHVFDIVEEYWDSLDDCCDIGGLPSVVQCGRASGVHGH